MSSGCGHEMCMRLAAYPNRCISKVPNYTAESETLETKVDKILEMLQMLEYLKFLENLDTTYLSELELPLKDEAPVDVLENFTSSVKEMILGLPRAQIKTHTGVGWTEYVCLDDVFSVLDEVRIKY